MAWCVGPEELLGDRRQSWAELHDRRQSWAELQDPVGRSSGRPSGRVGKGSAPLAMLEEGH